jgi:amino acid adenylation domain-containing protein
MTVSSAQERAARRHWSRILSRVTREDYWPDPTGESPEEIVVERRLGGSLTDQVTRATRGNPILRHALLSSAVAACFASYGGHRTVVIGVPALRDAAGEVPGPTVLPVPVVVEPGRSRRELLLGARQALLDAYAAQDCPYAWLREQAEPGGDGPGGPPAGWVVRDPAIHGPVPQERFDAVLEAGEEQGGGIVLALRAHAGPVRRTLLEYLLDRVLCAVTGILDGPGEPVAGVDSAGLRTPAVCGESLSAGRSVTELILDAAQRFPGRTALSTPDETVSYAALAARSAAVAHQIRRREVTGLVALLTGQTPATIVAALGALRAGVPYVVVPDGAPGGWKGLRERGVTLAVTAAAERGGPGITVCTLAQLEEAGPGGADLPPVPDPDTPAYATFTSGSTGIAKAVLVSHANLAASTNARRQVYGTCEDGFLLLSPLSFDSSVAGTYWTLTSGGTLHFVSLEQIADPAALLARARGTKAAATLGLPRVLESLTRTAADRELGHLRLIVGAGERFPASLASLVRRAAPQARLCNEYGPSEATVWSTWYEVTGQEAEVPIGRPVPGTWVQVLDASGLPLPPGLPGQLAIGGPQVAAGYLGAPALTAERFVPDPWLPGERLYLTGDYVWATQDGEIHFLGRRDDEVKVRGVRVQLADVEAILRDHPAVSDAASLVHGGELIAFISPRTGYSPDPGSLRAELADRLSSAALPSRIVPVASIPRLPNGKLRAAALLPVLEAAGGPASRPPADELEIFLLEQFRTVLGDPAHFGVENDFFAAGGDSIKAALLVAQLSREFATYIYVVAVLDHPTPAKLAAYLRTDYADAVASRAGAAAAVRPAGEPPAAGSEAEDRFRALFQPRVPPSTTAAPRRILPRAVFVLAPPRSGTTLLRVMLGGHRELFAPPELELLQFPTLAQRRESLSGRYAFYTEGLTRAVMALRDCSAGDAQAFLDRAADEGWTIPDTYAWLSTEAGGRLLVDKTTSYALDPAALARAEELFESPLYIHLTRHPQACISSFVKARLDQVYLRAEHGFTAAQAAELTWRVAQHNISVWSDRIDRDRLFRLPFEDLVADPAGTASRLCDFLGIAGDADMLAVHDDRTARMTDGLRPGGHMLGDIKFHQHSGIDAAVADSWRDGEPVATVHPRTWAVARELGYGPQGRLAGSPLSPTQRGIWFLEQLVPGTSTYNVPVAIQGTGNLDMLAVTRALRTVARRHHAFRSLIPHDEPGLRFAPNVSPVLDIHETPAAQQQARAQELAARPFALSSESPARLHILRDGERFTLLFVAHHLAIDAWSLGLVLQDFLNAYSAWGDGRTPDLPALTRQPADAAHDQAERAAEEAAAIALARAQDRLAAPSLLALPAVTTAAEIFPAVHSITLGLGQDTTRTVRQFSAVHGCTIFRTLFAVFAWTLHNWTGNRDFCIAIPALNRRPEDSLLVGMFVNTAVVRVSIHDSQTFEELVRHHEQPVRDAVEDAEVPFDILVDALGLGGAARNPLAQVMFSVQELQMPYDRCPELHLQPMELTPQNAKFEAAFVVTQRDGDLVVRADLSDGYFDDPAARRIAADFIAAAGDLTREPATVLRAVDAPAWATAGT